MKQALMAANEYRSYLRNHLEMETVQPRFHAAQSTAPTYRSLIFGTIAVIGLLQVASSVAILLHLTGYLREVRGTIGYNVYKPELLPTMW